MVTGAVEPTDSDCEWESSDDEDEETDEKVKELAVSTSSQFSSPFLKLTFLSVFSMTAFPNTFTHITLTCKSQYTG